MIDENLNKKFCISELRSLMFEATNDDQQFFIINMIIDFDEIETFIIKSHWM